MEGTVLVTKVQVWLVPSKFKFGPKDEPLGTGGVSGNVPCVVRERQSAYYGWNPRIAGTTNFTIRWPSSHRI